jgi:hypothetical protein
MSCTEMEVFPMAVDRELDITKVTRRTPQRGCGPNKRANPPVSM